VTAEAGGGALDRRTLDFVVRVGLAPGGLALTLTSAGRGAVQVTSPQLRGAGWRGCPVGTPNTVPTSAATPAHATSAAYQRRRVSTSGHRSLPVAR